MAGQLNEMSYFSSEVDEHSALLDYYAACSGNSLPAFRDNLPVPSSRIKIFLDRLSLKADKELPYYYVLLTLHLSIILAINHPDAKILFYNKLVTKQDFVYQVG